MFGHSFAVFDNGFLRGALTLPESGPNLRALVLGLYFLVLFVLWIFGVHRYILLYLYYRHRRNVPVPMDTYRELPEVTVQLAIFNEMYVVERLLDAVSRLDYPRDRLQIQILDDSTDETRELARARAADLARQGISVEYIHRTDRTGFKAGALANGLRTATGDFIAMFDADFVPAPDFLLRQIHFFTDPKVAAVQGRWDHINRDHSLLTRLQAIFLDGHFVLEHTCRHRSGRFFNFSGTAGMWRKAAIADAGGWQHDTLVEDLDLSFRAQLRGWSMVYLADHAVPAELPVEMNAFKSQQHRWAKGSAQAMRKLLLEVWRSRQPLRVKIEATFHLANNLAYIFMVALCVLLLPALHYRARIDSPVLAILFDVSLFVGATVSVFSFYATAQREAFPRQWKQRLLYLPMLMAMGIGICLNQARAVIEALAGHESPFVRTPKYAVEASSDRSWTRKRYRGMGNLVLVLEIAFTIYTTIIVAYAAAHGQWLAVPFLALFAAGFGFVSLTSVMERRRRAVPEAAPALAAPPRTA